MPGIHWRLYIDESGDFDRPRTPVIGALLARQDHPGISPGRLCYVLSHAAPHVPWPIHGFFLHQPAMHAAWACAAPHPYIPPAGVAAARRVFLERNSTLLARIEANIQAKRDPARADAQALDGLLQVADPVLHSVFRRVANETVRRVVDVLSGLAAPEGVSECWVLGTAEGEDGDAIPSEPGVPDRYLTLLACLLQRVMDSLALCGGLQEVEILPLERDVAGPMPGRRIRLHRGHVAEAARRATGEVSERPTWRRGQTSVTFVPLDPVAWNQRLHPALVLADLVAISMSGPLRTSNCLKQVTDEVRYRLGVEPVDSARLPTLSASGEVAACVADGRHFRFGTDEAARRVPRVTASPVRVWAWQQAITWAGALTRP